MKHLRVTATPDPEHAPAFFNVLANASAIDEIRTVDWNVAANGTVTFLYEIHGDAALFRDSAAETTGIDAVELAGVDENPSYALAQARPTVMPLFGAVSEAMARAGLIVRTPIVYREGEIQCEVVGEPAVLQAAIEESPAGMDGRIDEIGTFPGDAENPSATLSDRQREAIEVALDLGYYDAPRAATHEDVAGELDCAPSTASEHLRKAERNLVRAAMNGWRRA